MEPMQASVVPVTKDQDDKPYDYASYLASRGGQQPTDSSETNQAIDVAFTKTDDRSQKIENVMGNDQLPALQQQQLKRGTYEPFWWE